MITLWKISFKEKDWKRASLFSTYFLWCDETAQDYKVPLQRHFSRDLLNGTYVANFMNQVEVAFTRTHLC